MLRQLYIKNYTLIEQLDMQFYPGFSVLTGETGAGKSIILGAIGLLLGQRADSKVIKSGCDRCLIEAHFDIAGYGLETLFQENDIDYDADDCIIRRELTAAGKSRAFVNDTPVPLALLKEIGEQLVDIHSQHQNLLLNKHDFQLSVLDMVSRGQGAKSQLDDYQQAFAQYHATTQQLNETRESIARNRDNADFLQFQYNELASTRLVDGEQEELEQKQDTMSHAEDIKSALYQTDNALSADGTGIVEQLKNAMQALHSIEKVLPAAAELTERMDSCHIELKDMAQDISSLLDDVDFDPSELDAVNSRLDRIYELEKKYHCETIADLLALQEQLKQQLSAIENGDEALAELEARCKQQETACKRLADDLTLLRRKAAKEVEQQMRQRLVPLGMPHVRFEVSMEQTALNQHGQDKVAFLFSANTSTPLQPVAQVASGGEIARVMLALKAMMFTTHHSPVASYPTIIFDEIDTGVSGKIAESMAHMMQEMGQGEHQVISITHLPQIAALGNKHYRVFKEETPQGTASRMLLLDDDQRVREIAQMLSGSDITEAAVNNAKELLGGA